jgi:hypothetical protein
VATVTKTWSWASGAESWTAATYSGSFSAIGYNGSNGDPSSGCLEFAATSLATHVGELYIQGTWEDFGVPSGSVISAVRLTGLQSKCHAFTNGSVALAALYVTRTTNETEATVWGGRSASGVESSWVSSSGSSVSIPSGISASSTAVRVKMTAEIDMGFPSAPHGIYFDTLSLEITYDAAAKTASDSASVTEGATIVATLAASDAGTTTDSSSPARTEYLTASDSGTLGDAAGVEIDGTVYNVVSDSATVTDLASVTASVGVTEAPSVTDGTPTVAAGVGVTDGVIVLDPYPDRVPSDGTVAFNLIDADSALLSETAEVRDVTGGGDDPVPRAAFRHGLGCGCCSDIQDCLICARSWPATIFLNIDFYFPPFSPFPVAAKSLAFTKISNHRWRRVQLESAGVFTSHYSEPGCTYLGVGQAAARMDFFLDETLSPPRFRYEYAYTKCVDTPRAPGVIVGCDIATVYAEDEILSSIYKTWPESDCLLCRSFRLDVRSVFQASPTYPVVASGC